MLPGHRHLARLEVDGAVDIRNLLGHRHIDSDVERRVKGIRALMVVLYFDLISVVAAGLVVLSLGN